MQGEEIVNTIKRFISEVICNNAVLYRTNMEARSMIDTIYKKKNSLCFIR